MLKNLKNKLKNKKGFTLVELIVVIVIILVLAGTMVPAVTKYIGQAAEANVKQDAATMLTQIQAEYAESYSPDYTDADGVAGPLKEGSIVSNGTVEATCVSTLPTSGTDNQFTIDDEGVTGLYYAEDGKYITWTNGTWSSVEDIQSTNP